MNGVLELVAETNADGSTYLSHRYATPPFCLSKPYDHGTHLQVQLQQVGPGLLGGDRVSVNIEVCRGSLMLTSPSALRLLPKDGRPSLLHQKMTIRRDGCLEIWPEPLFPHLGGFFRQKNELVLEEGASLYWFDALAPGRDAAGERHVWEHLDLETFLWCENKLLLWERLRGSGKEWAEAALAFPALQPWTGVFYACTGTGEFAGMLRSLLEAKPPEGVQWGMSCPEQGLVSLKFMASDGQGIRTMRSVLMSAVRIHREAAKV